MIGDHSGDTLALLTAALADHYRVDHELGRGGMATVCLAQDLKHDRPVALKVLHPEIAASLGTERFLREIRLTARLQHPHILPVFDSGAVDGRPWYSMPMCRGLERCMVPPNGGARLRYSRGYGTASPMVKA